MLGLGRTEVFNFKWAAISLASSREDLSLIIQSVREKEGGSKKSEEVGEKKGWMKTWKRRRFSLDGWETS